MQKSRQKESIRISDTEREVLLKKIYNALREGGKFVFDVFTAMQYEGVKESTSWYASEGGFWKPDAHICLSSHYAYENNTRLNKYVVIDKEDKIDVFRIWDHYFSKEEITKEVLRAGFKDIEIYSDVSGELYSENSKTMCIVVEK